MHICYCLYIYSLTDGNELSHGTVLDYLSKLKEWFYRATRLDVSASFWPTPLAWYLKMRDRVTDKYMREAAEAGESLTKSPVRFPVEAVKAMVGGCLKGLASNNWKTSVEGALLILIDFLAVGRYESLLPYNYTALML